MKFKSWNNYTCALKYLVLAVAGLALADSAALAQTRVLPDNTLGEERSVVTSLDGLNTEVTGGARRGQNLFHSFQEFNIGEGERVDFLSPDMDIRNILVRVTGRNLSRIQGTLGLSTYGVDLFLLNPHGIVFDSSAKLDINGSFFATTADAIGFGLNGSRGWFKASDPSSSRLLSVEPSAFLFSSIANRGEIISRVNTRFRSPEFIGNEEQVGLSLLSSNLNPLSNLNLFGTILLLGGTVRIEGGLSAIVGRVEIGAVEGEGIVRLDRREDRLLFPRNLTRSDVFLTNSLVNVSSTIGGTQLDPRARDFLGLADGRGSVGITARNINLRNSTIRADVILARANNDFGLGLLATDDFQGGVLAFDATEHVSIDSSSLSSKTNARVRSDSGSIDIRANSFFMLRSQLDTNMTGLGRAGSITVRAREGLTLDDQSSIRSRVQSTGIGRGGDITLSSTFLNLMDGSQLLANTVGRGNAGDIAVNARTIRLRNDSDIRTEAQTLRSIDTNPRRGGRIDLTANSVVAFDDSDIFAFSTSGQGGNINFQTPAFISEPLYRRQPLLRNTEQLRQLDNNRRADVNASGVISGNISGVPDVTFLENSLASLEDNLVNPDSLLANSCIVRANQNRDREGNFIVTGSGGFPTHPGEVPISPYPTGEVRSLSSGASQSTSMTLTHSWRPGDPIVEPQGVYRFPNGRRIMSRDCLSTSNQ